MASQSRSQTIFSGTPYLQLEYQGKQLTLDLRKDVHIIGRDPQQADLVVPQDWLVVGRCQATIKKQGSNYFIYDGDGVTPSTNRLSVNNITISPDGGDRLQCGVEYHIGQNPENWVTLEFCSPNDPSYINPPEKRSVLIQNKTITIGRDDNADLLLDAPTVSRTHATVTQLSPSKFVLEDKSTNGVFVNGQKVQGATTLDPNATIRIGPYTLILRGKQLLVADQGQNIRIDANFIKRIVKGKNNRSITILNNISLPIEPGQFVALVGGSGAGKSTLMRTLLGIDPTTEGVVSLNGEDLRKNFNIYRTQIGYVPQQDIVHRDLRVKDVLIYAAKLRLPPDININDVVNRTLDQIEMGDRRDTFVRNLSGGQLKRVSIGVELLADPKLFFLDEPTSGLDPGLDKKMMQLLRKLANQGRTIILVTHATSNITQCDRIVFLGRGGNLCYFGPPDEAMNFFDIQSGDFADIYIKLESKQAVEAEAHNFLASPYHQRYVKNRLSASSVKTESQPPAKAKRSFFQQIGILSSRYLNLVLGDKVNLALALLTAPIAIVLINLALKDQDPLVPDPDVTNLAPLALRVLFVFTCTALWVGFSSSLQEIVKESAIYLRERLVNLGLFAYLGSKILVLGGLAIAQSILMSVVILLCFSSPESELMLWPLGVTITTFLTLFTCNSMGLMISASVKNSSQANSALPILLLPQIIFSGVLFSMEAGLGKVASWLMLSRWSVGAYGTLIDVNKLLPVMEALPDGTIPDLPFDWAEATYDPTWENLALNWGMLALHSTVYLAVTFLLQKKKDIL